jgi:hypothetical protein
VIPVESFAAGDRILLSAIEVACFRGYKFIYNSSAKYLDSETRPLLRVVEDCGPFLVVNHHRTELTECVLPDDDVRTDG